MIYNDLRDAVDAAEAKDERFCLFSSWLREKTSLVPIDQADSEQLHNPISIAGLAQVIAPACIPRLFSSGKSDGPYIH